MISRMLFTLLLVLSGPAEAKPPTFPETFECGTYQLVGKLESRSNGTDLLVMYPGTTAEYAIALRGVDAKTTTVYGGELVTVEARFSIPGKGSNSRALMLKFVGAAERAAAEREAVTRLKSEPCQEK